MRVLENNEINAVNGGVAPLIWFGAGIIAGYLMK